MEMRTWLRNSLVALGLVAMTSINCDAAKKKTVETKKVTAQKSVKSVDTMAQDKINLVKDKSTKAALNDVLKAMQAKKDPAVRDAVNAVAKCWSVPAPKAKAYTVRRKARTPKKEVVKKK